jgi:signal transduction histidine kinase/low affinity Fe/Cu permease
MPIYKDNIPTKFYYSIALFVALIIYAIDLSLPLGVADGSLYAAIALIGLLASNRNLIITGSALGIVLTIAGYYISPVGGETWKVLTNRMVSILTILMTAFICLKKQKAEDDIKTMHHNLDNQIIDRTSSLNEIKTDLEKKNKYLQLNKNIAEKVNENIDIEKIFQFCIKEICVLANAQIGHLYRAEHRYSNRLIPGKTWHIENGFDSQNFKQLTEEHIFESGIGLPGRVHKIKKPIWIERLDLDLNFPRANGPKPLSIKSGFAFPIFIGERITGVMEFFFSEQKKPDDDLLGLMGQTGIQLGRVLERRFSEKDKEQLLSSLEERVKELTCMSEVAKLITVSSTMDNILDSLEDLIIPAWQFPDLTLVRISFEGKTFGSKLFPKTPWVISTDIIVNGEKRGILEVCYSDQPQNTKDQVFLIEEGNLLTWIGQILSSVASRLKNAGELEVSNTELRGLYNKLENVREMERTRISREIHDEIGQALTLLKLDLTTLKPKVLTSFADEVEQQINRMLQQIDTSLEELNRITSELRPHALNIMGLCEALKLETEKFINLTGIKCCMNLSNEIPKLHPDLFTLIFRVYQEALTNIIRHSNAKNVDIQFYKKGDLLNLMVKDDGKGINADKAYNSNSFGLTGIRERVKEWDGDFNINGDLGKGTQIFVSVPLNS